MAQKGFVNERIFANEENINLRSFNLLKKYNF